MWGDRLSDDTTLPYNGDNEATNTVPVHDGIKEDLSSLSNSQLREKLESLGERPGPINHLTRKVYISYLQKILDGTQPAGNQGLC